MSNIPALTGSDLIKILEKIGFIVIRRKGSHCFMRHSDGRSTVIPVHSGETVGSGLFSKILREVDISKEEFRKLSTLRKKK